MRACAALALLFLSAPAWSATVGRTGYGVTKDGRAVEQVTLANDRGMTVRIISYGAIVTDIIVPDAQGSSANVALGFATLAEYEAKNGNYGFGAVIGRYAGRIADARFTIGGKEVRLTANDGPNALHGGPGGFDTRVWTIEPFKRGGSVGAVLGYSSPAGEQGFPGRLDVRVTYTLTPDNALRIDYRARTDAPTVLNLTNHSYFNLAGAGSGSIRGHRLQIAAHRFIETDSRGIPASAFPAVANTPFDFRRFAAIGSVIDRAHPQMDGRRGYNHGWRLAGGRSLRLAARLADPSSGRSLEVRTTEPSLHVYTANWFSGRDSGAQGRPYGPHDGIALETQHLPDSPNRPAFPSTLLRPGETFRSTTVYRFSAS